MHPARDTKENRSDQDKQLQALNRELVELNRGTERLYEGVEKGVNKLDDTLRDRVHKLQARR